ncbi:quinone oxidoreductase [Citricoccus sp. SGAir0253]|uniref:quinone oxidoreductase family protein n=1 Tax=Citricoccus sp. SGAir0253 TaxID=2567881 RepID=UPI0010CCF0AF|nr:quinone oxidoreductase [Citricoccus sp. SGAir0253]QCU77774.1 quinone oxidoreductase [Citricoccus sp. SGAir0253]
MTDTALPRTQHAIRVHAPGGPAALQWTEVPVPAPGPGEVLVRTAAAGLNFIETYQRSGVYRMPHPFVPGSEGAGTVVAVGGPAPGAGPDAGPGTPGGTVAVGDVVATAAGSGTYAEYFTAPVAQLLPVPAGVDPVTAAAIPLQGMTAHYLCRSTFPVEAGQTVLVHAGAGGVGLLLTQLCTARGATVITTASTEEKKELSRAAGAHEVLDYEGFADRVRELTGGEGAHVVFDGVGKDTFDESLRSLRVRGMLVLFGGSSGQVPPFDLQRLNAAGSLFVTRPTLRDYTRTAEETRWRAGELFAALEAGTLTFRVGARYPLQDAAEAHRDLEGRRTTGKSLLVPA